MATRLGVSHDTAAKDRRWCLEQWRKTRETDTAAHADQEYAQLVAFRGEAWAGWRKSQQTQEEISATEEEDTTSERVAKQVIGGPMDGTTTGNLVPVRTHKRTRHSVRRTETAGDLRFLVVGLKATEKVIDLLGPEGSRGAVPAAPSTDLAALVQSNPAFMADMLAALDRAGLLNPEMLAAGEEEDDEEDLDALGAPGEDGVPALADERQPADANVGRHSVPR